MKDRQPTQVLSNGAIRYGVYNADGTLNHYEYLKREDAPTVEGTPLNKANLLSDTTRLARLRRVRPKSATSLSPPAQTSPMHGSRATGALYHRSSIQNCFLCSEALPRRFRGR